MTKFIFSLIFTFSLLFLSNVESKGQCETGYSSKTVTIQAGNCDYIVEVCYKCELHHPGIVKINKWWQLDSTCINALDIDLVLGQIYQEISDGSFIYANFCTDGLYNTPPCSTGYNEFVIHYAYCWQQWYRHNGVGPVRSYWPCEDNAGCSETIRVCVLNPGPPIVFQTTRNVSLTSPQDPPCELEWYEINWPTVLGTKSDCFILNEVPCGIE